MKYRVINLANGFIIIVIPILMVTVYFNTVVQLENYIIDLLIYNCCYTTQRMLSALLF